MSRRKPERRALTPDLADALRGIGDGFGSTIFSVLVERSYWEPFGAEPIGSNTRILRYAQRLMRRALASRGAWELGAPWATDARVLADAHAFHNYVAEQTALPEVRDLRFVARPNERAMLKQALLGMEAAIGLVSTPPLMARLDAALSTAIGERHERIVSDVRTLTYHAREANRLHEIWRQRGGRADHPIATADCARDAATRLARALGVVA